MHAPENWFSNVAACWNDILKAIHCLIPRDSNLIGLERSLGVGVLKTRSGKFHVPLKWEPSIWPSKNSAAGKEDLRSLPRPRTSAALLLFSGIFSNFWIFAQSSRRKH